MIPVPGGPRRAPVLRAGLLARVAALTCALGGAACGWRAGLPLPEGARSIGVQAVTREGTLLERGLEPELTDALSRAVVDWVDLPLESPARADLVVRAEILDYRRRGGVRNVENELVETAVLVRASAELYDRRSGRVLGPAVIAQQWSGFALEESRAVSNEEDARERAIRSVAQTLVLDLFQALPTTPGPDPSED